MKIILEMCARGGVFRTTDPVTSVDAKSGLSDVDLAAGAVARAEVIWRLATSLSVAVEYKGHRWTSHTLEKTRDIGIKLLPGSKIART